MHISETCALLINGAGPPGLLRWEKTGRHASYTHTHSHTHTHSLTHSLTLPPGVVSSFDHTLQPFGIYPLK